MYSHTLKDMNDDDVADIMDFINRVLEDERYSDKLRIWQIAKRLEQIDVDSVP